MRWLLLKQICIKWHTNSSIFSLAWFWNYCGRTAVEWVENSASGTSCCSWMWQDQPWLTGIWWFSLEMLFALQCNFWQPLLFQKLLNGVYLLLWVGRNPCVMAFQMKDTTLWWWDRVLNWGMVDFRVMWHTEKTKKKKISLKNNTCLLKFVQDPRVARKWRFGCS